MISMRAGRAFRGSVLVVGLASVLLSCSGGPDKSPGEPAASGGGVRAAASSPAAGTEEPGAGSDPASPAVAVEKVRDVFARLQATYNDGCTTPGNCDYFLGRVLDELNSLDAAMKADPQGPGHFEQPVEWIAGLRSELGGDRSFENLKKHQDLLTGTRDKINAWMQGHPEDYR